MNKRKEEVMRGLKMDGKIMERLWERTEEILGRILTEDLRGVVTNPIKESLAEMKDELVEMKEELVREIRGEREGLQEVNKLLEEVRSDLGKRVKEVEERGIQKQLKKQRVRELMNNETMKRLWERTEKLSGKTRVRVRLGLLILYLTGMRIDTLRSLGGEWFSRNIIRNQDPEIRYVPNKQNEERELIVWLRGEDRKLIGELYMEYKRKYRGEPFEMSRVHLNNLINGVLREEGVTSHSFRYSVIMKLGKEKGILVANQFIGHRRLETTNRYMMSLLEKEDIKIANKVLTGDIKWLLKGKLGKKSK